jgi:hypothetical protein
MRLTRTAPAMTTPSTLLKNSRLGIAPYLARGTARRVIQGLIYTI